MIRNIILFTNTKQLEKLNLKDDYKIIEIGSDKVGLKYSNK